MHIGHQDDVVEDDRYRRRGTRQRERQAGDDLRVPVEDLLRRLHRWSLREIEPEDIEQVPAEIGVEWLRRGSRTRQHASGIASTAMRALHRVGPPRGQDAR